MTHSNDYLTAEELRRLQGMSHEMLGSVAMELNVHEVVLGAVSHWYGCEVETPAMRQGTPPKECNERCQPPR